MSQSYPLDSVIREVTRNVKPASDVEKLVVIDVGSKRSVEKKRAFRETKYFIVSNTLDGRSGIECRTPLIQFKDFENDRSVAIQVAYLAACEPGREERVAEALFDGPHPAAVLNEKIKRWLVEYASFRQADFIQNFFELQPQIQAYIKSKAYEETGLSLSVKIDLKGGKEEPGTVALGPMNFEVRVNDCDEAQSIDVRAELCIDEQNKINAIMHRRDKAALETLVKEEIQGYFAQYVSLNAFWEGLHVGDLKQQVINRLNQALRPIGRKVGFISLTSEINAGGGHTEPFFETDINVTCRIKDYPQSVVIKNTVQMILKDVARYRINKSPELKAWIEAKLQRVIREMLLEKNCTDLLLTFSQVEQDIKEILDREAYKIGYGIKQLLTVPDLEPLNWLEPFTLEVKQSFETRLPRFNVKLEIAVTARINDLRGIQSYVNRGQNVPQLMEKVIIEKAKEFLHTVDPERFYIRFSSTNDEREKTVERELIDRISDALADLYNADIISVTPKMGDTEITERLRHLQKEVCQFDMEVFLADSEAIVPVHFIGVFKVESVDANGWHKFQQLRYDIEKIKQYIESNVAAELDQCLKESRAAAYAVNSLEQLIKKLTEECIRDVYGLTIKVHSVRRLHNELEKAEREVRRHLFDKVNEADRNRADSLVIQLKKAEDVLSKMLDEDGVTEAEINRQEEKIRLIRNKLPQGYASSRGKFKQLSASQISGKDSLLGSTVSSKRLTSGTQPQEGANDGD